MSTYIEPAATVSEAWLRTVEVVVRGGGRLVNVLTTITEPGSEDAHVRAVIDQALDGQERRAQSVETVAGTIFPAELYRDVGYPWRPGLSPDEAEALDDAATALFDSYELMLPLLLTANGNKGGTYFSRMVTWPGKEPGGVNQLADRIRYLRGHRTRGVTANNAADIAIGGEADIPDQGLQVYAATDRRQRAFPCLVHIDLTLLAGRLSMLAVYRHQFLLTKAYGNLIGLSDLLKFLAQQTGFDIGELAVQATLADDERGSFSGRAGVEAIIAAARAGQAVA
ncbi:MAG: hypothetical protein H0U52_17190 [Chloroflexi bacterium]|nr:hypothetical protein [Chloroflexota bacterium]